ncbi:hypothetical protein LX32DRAFT_189083 [Colletotrichum zoysiae]|uniref:Uncharacterized protein n=1 Tax=Colletotrichum zoysiae TaxID=1216348 RepID=A0AAD9HNP4_9PEZI|nr:hypothetical protein LX32DRAFT_189083 [Colletotrichum zoysiae]
MDARKVVYGLRGALSHDPTIRFARKPQDDTLSPQGKRWVGSRGPTAATSSHSLSLTALSRTPVLAHFLTRSASQPRSECCVPATHLTAEPRMNERLGGRRSCSLDIYFPAHPPLRLWVQDTDILYLLTLFRCWGFAFGLSKEDGGGGGGACSANLRPCSIPVRRELGESGTAADSRRHWWP